MGNYIKTCCKSPSDDSQEINNYKNTPSQNIAIKNANSSSRDDGSPLIKSPQTGLLTSNSSTKIKLMKPLNFLNDDVGVAINILTSANVYERMRAGIELNSVLSQLEEFKCQNLYKIMEEVFYATKELISKEEHKKHMSLYSIDFSGQKIKELPNKKEFINIISQMTEVFHFFKLDTARKYPYDANIWNDKQVLDIIENIKKSVTQIKSEERIATE